MVLVSVGLALKLVPFVCVSMVLVFTREPPRKNLIAYHIDPSIMIPFKSGEVTHNGEITPFYGLHCGYKLKCLFT